jgi:hypothetical protein
MDRREDEAAALRLLNEVESAEELARRIELPEERDVGLRLAERILKRRAELGGAFSSLDEMDAIEQIGPQRMAAIIAAAGAEDGAKSVTPDRVEITTIQAERLSGAWAWTSKSCAGRPSPISRNASGGRRFRALSLPARLRPGGKDGPCYRGGSPLRHGPRRG